MRSTKLTVCFWMILPGLLTASHAASPSEYVVVVNASNDYSANPEKMKQVVKQLFLKDRVAWPNNIESRPFAGPHNSERQRAFLKNVLQMTGSELAKHWLSVKQRTGETPPQEINRESLMIRLIGKYEGAFAVISRKNAESANHVRILFTFSD